MPILWTLTDLMLEVLSDGLDDIFDALALGLDPVTEMNCDSYFRVGDVCGDQWRACLER
jgi:hypothetical protein